MAISLAVGGRYGEATAMLRKAIGVMEKQENGEMEQAITWLDMADTAEEKEIKIPFISYPND